MINFSLLVSYVNEFRIVQDTGFPGVDCRSFLVGHGFWNTVKYMGGYCVTKRPSIGSQSLNNWILFIYPLPITFLKLKFYVKCLSNLTNIIYWGNFTFNVQIWITYPAVRDNIHHFFYRRVITSASLPLLSSFFITSYFSINKSFGAVDQKVADSQP